MASTQSPYFISQQQQYTTPPQDHSFNFNTRVSPSILLIIIILAVIFFVSGLLHLLVRFLLRPGAHYRTRPRHDDDDVESVSALQGQLQQLFHLHDAGVDQSFIDSLPVFPFSSVAAANAANAFDCAVCLCEFEPPDTLRLLPRCSHAFHTECIDTWLLSHSTCPLCRASLLSSPGGSYSPVVLVATENFPPAPENDENPTSLRDLISEEKESVVTVKLGKFTSLDDGGEASSSSVSVSISASNSVGSRRCFSMGSFAYVMDETSDIRVPVRTVSKKALAGPKNRAAVSECDCESKREFEFTAEISKKESFSISKIWARGNGGRVDGSRRAFSFRFQRNLQGNNGNAGPGEDWKAKNGEFPRRTLSEIGVARRGSGEAGLEEESQSCNSLDSQSNQPSFARKTLLWLMGRQQNKVDPNHP